MKYNWNEEEFTFLERWLGRREMEENAYNRIKWSKIHMINNNMVAITLVVTLFTPINTHNQDNSLTEIAPNLTKANPSWIKIMQTAIILLSPLSLIILSCLFATYLY